VLSDAKSMLKTRTYLPSNSQSLQKRQKGGLPDGAFQGFLEFMMPRHLSAYSQYSRHELFLSGLLHSALHSVHTATSSSLQISTSAPHT